MVKSEPPYQLKNATRFEVQGRHVGASASGGSSCRMPRASLVLRAHESAVELRQVALNRRTCRAVFERGIPPSSTRRLPSGKRESGGQHRGTGAASGVSTQHHTYRFGGYSRAWYTDVRTNKVVNSVYSGADWNSRGGCIGSNNVWFITMADRSTGWDEVSHRWGYIDDICRYLVSSVNANFRDPSFRGCQGGRGPVETFYHRVRFIGYPSGGIRGSRRSWVEPSCKDVLIAYMALYRR